MSIRNDIVNQALIFLGADVVTSVEDDSAQADIMKRLYPLSRDATLEAFEWSFAIRRFIPAASVDAPEWKWAYAYPLPSDIIRLLQVDRGPYGLNFSSNMQRNEVDHVLEGREILTNEHPIYCTGIRRIEDEGIYSNLFCDALSAKLAMKACYAITESNSKMEAMAALYAKFIDEAKSRDGQQGTTRRLRSHWLNASRRGRYG